MEWLQTLENLLYDMAFVVQYSRTFVIAVSVAILLIFWGLIMININIREAVKGNKELWEELQAIKALIREQKGDKHNE